MHRFVRTILMSFVLPAFASAAPFNAATATNEVGLDVFRGLGAKHANGNLVISPYSIESALALAYAGADGTTREELARTLHLPNDASADTEIMTGFRGLRGNLDALATHARPNALVLRAANRLFAQKDHSLRENFVTLMRDGYDAPLEPLDFRHAAESARGTINDWVSAQTRDRIKNVIPAGGVNEQTRLVLVNALYLKARWNVPFEHEHTHRQPFHLSSSESAEVQTMNRHGTMPYAHENGLTVVALEYLSRELQCLIILPDEGLSVDAAAARIGSSDLRGWAELAKNTPWPAVNLYLPKFKTQGATLPLGATLRALGANAAFDQPAGTANFDRIAPRTPNNYLALSEVFHQTFVALDEEGTEAAAATAISAMTLGVAAQSHKPIEVRVDRPFVFAIQHRPSGAVLFLGRIVDPR